MEEVPLFVFFFKRILQKCDKQRELRNAYAESAAGHLTDIEEMVWDIPYY